MAKVKIKGLVSCAGRFTKDGSIGNLISISANKTYEVDDENFDVDKLLKAGFIEIVKDVKPAKKPTPQPEIAEEDNLEETPVKRKRTKKVVKEESEE